MTDLADLSTQYPPAPESPRMSDGSEMFPYLWRYFLSHPPLRDWLMRAAPYAAASVAPRHVSQGIAFCCNFAVPPLWHDMAASFDLGEMFIPDHAYSHFMCGSVVAATSFHKHLVCALGPAASRHPSCLASYRTCVRRMVVDMGSSRSINIMEFSWMEDGALIVTCKVLVPPDRAVPYQSAGCTGAFALFTDVRPGGAPPTVPRSLVSFIEAPRCPFCVQRGALGCYCSSSMAARAARIPDEYSSAVWPPRIANDVEGTAIDTYHNIRSRLDLIQHIAHVKITAHVVTTQEVTRPFGPPTKTYKLGPSRFVVRSVLFRPSNSFEADTLRQVADKLRLLRAGSLGLASAYEKTNPFSRGRVDETATITEVDEDQSLTAQMSGPNMQCRSTSEIPISVLSTRQTEGVTVQSSETSRVSSACGSCGKTGGVHNASCQKCSFKQPATADGVSRSRATSVNEVISKVTEAPSSNVIPPKRLGCHLCDKTFSQQGSLNRHLKNIHEERKIPCQFCAMSFGQMFDLKRHQKRKHADRYASNIRRDRIDTRLLRTAVQREVN